MAIAKILNAADPVAIRQGGDLLKSGHLVAFPTETVYGLGADASNLSAINLLYKAKGRPAENPLIIHVHETEEAWRIAQSSRPALTLARLFWPGPLSLVLPWTGEGLCARARARLPTVAVRVPSSPAARALIEAAGRPIAAPSANRSNRVSPSSVHHVDRTLPGLELVLDGGPCSVGLESTILELCGPIPRLLRPGAISVRTLREAIGEIESIPAFVGKPNAPGQYRLHYAPEKPVRILARPSEPPVRPDEALVILAGDHPVATGYVKVLRLSPDGSLEHAAQRYYDCLHACDADPAIGAIAVEPVPDEGIGRALNDRLRRATGLA